MIDLKDVNNIEGGAESPEAFYKSVQRAINSGESWKLQGHYGRTMMDALNSGFCLLGRSPANDYWGNRIPARGEVQAGTKGSREFVVKHHGEDWAKLMEEVT